MKSTILSISIIVLLTQCTGKPPASITSRTAARLILADSLLPSDDSMTFAVMDSIVSEKRSVRDYYFPTFQKIVDKADGALAEGVGSRVLLYVTHYPMEFSDRFKDCSTGNECWDDLLRQASFAGEEIMMREDNKKEYAELVNQLDLGYSNWKSDSVMSAFMGKLDKVRSDWKN